MTTEQYSDSSTSVRCVSLLISVDPFAAVQPMARYVDAARVHIPSHFMYLYHIVIAIHWDYKGSMVELYYHNLLFGLRTSDRKRKATG
jgi:hypothetical protein